MVFDNVQGVPDELEAVRAGPAPSAFASCSSTYRLDAR